MTTTDEAGMIKLPSGKATIRMDDGHSFTLRRPKLGEYKALREHISDAPPSTEDDPDNPGQKRRVEDAEAIAIAYQVEWWRLLEDPEGKGRSMIVEGTLPESADDYDYWMVTGLVQVALFGHWAAAPLDLSR
jgi:hypothetical protein